LAPGGVGKAYSIKFTVEGGLPPYIWSFLGSTPPPGLALSPEGVLSGVPTSGGRFNLNLRVDHRGSGADSRTFQLTITGGFEEP